MQTHEPTPGKPCRGGGFCCNRPLFDRQMFPCSVSRVLHATREERDSLRSTLKAALAAWVSEASQGDGIAEEHWAIFERARLLCGYEGPVLCPVANARRQSQDDR